MACCELGKLERVTIVNFFFVHILSYCIIHIHEQLPITSIYRLHQIKFKICLNAKNTFFILHANCIRDIHAIFEKRMGIYVLVMRKRTYGILKKNKILKVKRKILMLVRIIKSATIFLKVSFALANSAKQLKPHICEVCLKLPPLPKSSHP